MEFDSGNDPGDETPEQLEQPEQLDTERVLSFDRVTEDAPIILSRLDRQRERHDARVLVCEGVCNPDIHDYDQLVIRFGGGRPDLLPYIKERARALRHTLHIREGDSFWHIVGGWSRRFRCTHCGHLRRF